MSKVLINLDNIPPSALKQQQIQQPQQQQQLASSETTATTYAFRSIFLDDENHRSRTFAFKLPGRHFPTEFCWKNSTGSNKVKRLGKTFLGKGMKLVGTDTKEIVMAFVKPACWETIKTRQGERKGRLEFVGERTYGEEFETLALFTLLIMIDSKWDC